MPQTILAVLAMMLLTFFSLQQQKHAVQTQREIISTELEIMANAVAADKVQYLAGKRFDKNVNDENIETVSASELTPESDFGDGSPNCWDNLATCQYVSEFHNDTHVETFSVEGETAAETVEFAFTVDTEISYVHEDGSDASSQTWFKRAKLTIDTVKEEYLQGEVTITRRLSPVN